MPTFMQKIKLNEQAISQVPLITPIRACKQHAAGGEENKDFKFAEESNSCSWKSKTETQEQFAKCYG